MLSESNNFVINGPLGTRGSAVDKTLLRIVVRLERNPSLHEDLFQEAAVHFWLQLQNKPGQRLSWYLQSCQFHIKNYVSSGRSLDSLRHRCAQVYPCEDSDLILQEPENWNDNESVLSSVSAREML